MLILLAGAPAIPAARLKDLVSIEGVRDNQLIGYGLVVGLAGTGDRRQTMFSAQSLTNLLQRMGVAVSPTAIQVANTAAVMVTATLPAFAQPGAHIDTTVAAIGDCSNLQGGILVHDLAARRRRHGICRGPGTGRDGRILERPGRLVADRESSHRRPRAQQRDRGTGRPFGGAA